MTHVHLIARDNGAGLSRDLQILAQALAEGGFEVTISALGAGGWRRQRRLLGLRARLRWSEWRSGGARGRFDVNLMLEQVLPKFLPLARRNALIPNPEWFRPEFAQHLPRIDRVLVKTRHAAPLFEALSCRTLHIGFTSSDRMDRSIVREREFFHLAGRSGNKGSAALIELWQRNPAWPLLTIVQRQKLQLPAKPVANLRFVTDYLDEADLHILANRCLFHLCPSETEGFGHNICEGMSVGSLLLTTDAPPMNELVTPQRGVLVAYARTGKQRLATTYFTDTRALGEGIERMLAMDLRAADALRKNARDWYERNDIAFRRNLTGAIAALASS